MSAPNFRPMQYGMPMVCGGDEDFEEMKELYEKDTGYEYSYGMYLEDLENDFNEADDLAKAFSENLIFHDVTVESGYYSGFQFYVEEKYSAKFDLDRDSEYCIDNEDAHYYFDLCRSRAIRAADAEKRKIRKWLEKLAENSGYDVLVCTAVFSNGEACYSKRTKRTEMIAAARA